MLTYNVVTATCNHIISNIIRVRLALHYTNFTSHIGVHKCGNVTNSVEVVAQVFQQLTTAVSIVHNLKRQSARNDTS